MFIFIALRTYSDFSVLLLRLRPVVVRPRPVRAEKAELIGRFRYIYLDIYIFLPFLFVSTLYSSADSRSTKYLDSKLPPFRTSRSIRCLYSMTKNLISVSSSNLTLIRHGKRNRTSSSRNLKEIF